MILWQLEGWVHLGTVVAVMLHVRRRFSVALTMECASCVCVVCAWRSRMLSVCMFLLPVYIILSVCMSVHLQDVVRICRVAPARPSDGFRHKKFSGSWFRGQQIGVFHILQHWPATHHCRQDWARHKHWHRCELAGRSCNALVLMGQQAYTQVREAGALDRWNVGMRLPTIGQAESASIVWSIDSFRVGWFDLILI